MSVTQPRDTSSEAHGRQVAALRTMTPAQRIAAAAEMTDGLHRLIEAGVRDRRPELSAAEVSAAVAEILLGGDLAARTNRARVAER